MGWGHQMSSGCIRKKTGLDFEREIGDEKMQSKALGKGQRCIDGKHQAENFLLI